MSSTAVAASEKQRCNHFFDRTFGPPGQATSLPKITISRILLTTDFLGQRLSGSRMMMACTKRVAGSPAGPLIGANSHAEL